MTNLKIGRLSLEVPGMSETDAKRLSNAIAERLATQSSVAKETVRLSNLKISIGSDADRSVNR
jgi:hypothetical protein